MLFGIAALRKDEVIDWGCVFKVTFPNAKIYVGSDTAKNARLDFFKYFGSPVKAKTEMLADLERYLSGDYAYTLKKELLFSQANVRIGDVLKEEQRLIALLDAKNPNVGYNR